MILILVIFSAAVLASADEADFQFDDMNYEEDEDRIINGKAAGPNQIPYQVVMHVFHPENNTLQCGGSLISDRWVLTAAHCMKGGIYTLIILGENNLTNIDNSSMVTTADEVHIHPGFVQTNLTNDIALIKMHHTANFSDKIMPIVLPRKGDVIRSCEKLIVSGFGKTKNNETSGGAILNHIETESISNPLCTLFYGKYFISNSTLCCLGEDNKSTCQGDSGGPLVKMVDGIPELVGSVSFGPFMGCEIGWPVAFTCTEYYLDWIEEVMNPLPVNTNEIEELSD